MSKIFKNMIPYWKSILVILMLLFVQAWCDLSLPSYTSDIIDVGIQNSGVEHVTPKRIKEEEFQTAKFIMTDDEADLWESLYTKKNSYYVAIEYDNSEGDYYAVNPAFTFTDEDVCLYVSLTPLPSLLK